MSITTEVVVVGSGFAGATCARKLAEAGIGVTVLEKRKVVGGNASETFRDNGCLVQEYGPHIFHTSNPQVINFVERFDDWRRFTHCVGCHVDGVTVPMPIGFWAIDQIYDAQHATTLKKELAEQYGQDKRIPIMELFSSRSEHIKRFAHFVFEKVFVTYSQKQWGIPIESIDLKTLARVPVVIGYQDGYFEDDFQGVPVHGFGQLIRNILSHQLIEVRCGVDFSDVATIDSDHGRLLVGALQTAPIVIYSGPIDRLFSYQYGALPYRTTDFVFEDLNQDSYQNYSVVNHPQAEGYTRKTEFKRLTGQEVLGATTVMTEYPRAFDPSIDDDPLYPISSDESKEQHRRYQDVAASFENLWLCGRLAEYRYYDMDDVVIRAHEVADQVLEKVAR